VSTALAFNWGQASFWGQAVRKSPPFAWFW
jgi:hypothetical protein